MVWYFVMTQCLSVHIVAPSSSPVVTRLLYKPHNAKVSLYSVPALELNCWRYVSGRFRVNSLRITRTPEISRRWMQIAKLQLKSQTEWHPCSIVKNVTGECVGEADGWMRSSFFLSSEVNECLQFGTCSQYCTNTKGTYKCTCDRNFKEIDGECITKGKNDYCLIQIDSKRIQCYDILFHF